MLYLNLPYNVKCYNRHTQVQKVLSEGVQFWPFFFFFFFFLVDEGREYNRAIISPPAKPHLNVVLLVCWWLPTIECWLGSFVIFQGIRGSGPVLLRNSIFLWFFRGVLTPCPRLWIRKWRDYSVIPQYQSLVIAAMPSVCHSGTTVV